MTAKEAKKIQKKYNKCGGPATMDRNCGHADGYLEAHEKANKLVNHIKMAITFGYTHWEIEAKAAIKKWEAYE